MSQNLLDQLRMQHNNLKKGLNRIKSRVMSQAVAYPSVCEDLKKFKKALAEHLRLENESFYPELLKKFKDKHQETGYIEKFISEMKELERDVLGFLKRYDNPAIIEDKFSRFKGEFDFIVSSLLIRIGSEEDGVFLYW